MIYYDYSLNLTTLETNERRECNCQCQCCSSCLNCLTSALSDECSSLFQVIGSNVQAFNNQGKQSRKIVCLPDAFVFTSIRAPCATIVLLYL